MLVFLGHLLLWTLWLYCGQFRSFLLFWDGLLHPLLGFGCCLLHRVWWGCSQWQISPCYFFCWHGSRYLRRLSGLLLLGYCLLWFFGAVSHFSIQIACILCCLLWFWRWSPQLLWFRSFPLFVLFGCLGLWISLLLLKCLHYLVVHRRFLWLCFLVCFQFGSICFQGFHVRHWCCPLLYFALFFPRLGFLHRLLCCLF